MKSNRRIVIDGPFERGMAASVCDQLQRLARESDEDILITINSYGGDCCAAFAILDTIRAVEHRCAVHTLAIGKVMSAGALITASGTKGKRMSLPSTRFMFHGPNGRAVLTHDGLNTMRFFKEEQESIYAEITGRSPLYFDELMNRDFYCTPEEAIEHGLLDGIVGSIYNP